MYCQAGTRADVALTHCVRCFTKSYLHSIAPPVPHVGSFLSTTSSAVQPLHVVCERTKNIVSPDVEHVCGWWGRGERDTER